MKIQNFRYFQDDIRVYTYVVTNEKIRVKIVKEKQEVLLMKLEIGKAAPEFDLPSHKGGNISLSSLKGKKVLIYFYPKDDTPGCTKEACSFRDAFADILAKNVVVLGVSKDDISSHIKFAWKYHLTFDLLSDTAGEVVEKYGVWVEKNNYGKKYMGIERSSFLINESGNLEKVWERVKPEEHIDEVLEYLESK